MKGIIFLLRGCEMGQLSGYSFSSLRNIKSQIIYMYWKTSFDKNNLFFLRGRVR